MAALAIQSGHKVGSAFTGGCRIIVTGHAKAGNVIVVKARTTPGGSVMTDITFSCGLSVVIIFAGYRYSVMATCTTTGHRWVIETRT